MKTTELTIDEALVMLTAAANGFALIGMAQLLNDAQREKLGRILLATRGVIDDPDRWNVQERPANETIELFISGADKLAKLAHGIK